MKLKKLSLFTFIVVLLAMFTTTVKADGFNVRRDVSGVANPVTNTFTYTVTADANNPDTVTPPTGTFQVIMSNVAPVNNVASQTASPLIAESAWTGLNYPKPGTYKFTVKENTSSNPTLYPVDTTSKYVVTIFVENAVDPTTSIPTGSLNKTYVGSVLEGDSTKISKTQNAVFASDAGGRSYLTITKTVKGNMADTSQCFDVTVELSDVTAGETYTVAGSSCSNSDIVVSSTPGTTTATATVHLKHGDTLTIGKSGNINQLPVDAGYTLTEAAATGFDNTAYTTKVNGTDGRTSGPQTVTAVASSNTYAFENTAQETTPTGIVIRLIPFVILLALTVVGLYAVMQGKKREE